MASDRARKRRRHNVPIMSPEEIEGIRTAGRMTAEILDLVESKIRPGITTDEINDWVHTFTIEHGAIPAPLNYRGFPKSCCTSINSVICHGIPDATYLKIGDIINVDVTTIVDGFYGDASRMCTIGEVKPTAERLCRVAKECLDIGIAEVRPGNTLGDVGYQIQRHAEANGYSVVRSFTGHGIGRKFHEPPEVMHVGQPGRGLTLEAGMVFTIEPMINEGRYECRILNDGWTAVTIDGLLSAQWEHTIVVSDDGADILTV